MKTKRVSIVLKREAPARPPLRPRIVEAARGLFLSRGFVRVTADDIAAEIGVSKATLYKEFASKEDILRAVVRGLLAEIVSRVDAIINNEEQSLVERLVALFAFVGGRLSLLGPVFFRDIQKSAPAIWREIEDFRRDKLLTNFKIFLADGHKQGLFRGDVDDDLMVRMFIRLVEGFVSPAEMLRSGRTPTETFESVIKVFFQGVLTDKGRLDFSSGTPGLFEPRKEGAS